MTPKLQQLYALRAMVDALVMAEEMGFGFGQTPDPNACPCGAPEEAQVVRDTLDGTQRRFCKVCKQERVLE